MFPRPARHWDGPASTSFVLWQHGHEKQPDEIQWKSRLELSLGYVS